MAKKRFRPVPGGMVLGIVKGIVLLACILSAVSCNFPQGTGGGEGSLTVVFPAGNSGGGGPGKSSSYYTDTVMAGMRYEMTLTGPGGPITQTATAGGVTLSLEPGVWTIAVDAYSGAAMTGSGTETVTVVAGRSDSVKIKMNYASGLGGLSEYYIHNEAELRQIGDASYFGLRGGDTITFKLANDLSVTTLANGWLFSGPNLTLDGQGHTITFAVNDTVTVDILGLFTNNSGTIQDLTLAGSITITHSGIGELTVGAVAGQNQSGGTIKNVASTVAITTNSSSTGSSFRVGGIAGDNYGTIEKCYTRGPVNGASSTSSGYVGGIAGFTVAGSGAIRNCYTRGDVTANTGSADGYAGGIAGSNNNSLIEYCYAAGDVYVYSTGTTKYAGGITGFTGGSGTTRNCAALNSKVSGTSTFYRIGGGVNTNNYAYAKMQTGLSSSPVVGGLSGNGNGAGISDTTLQASGYTSFWCDTSTLNWPVFQAGQSSTEPVGSPWYWSKTIDIPGNLVTSNTPLLGVYVPALWFEP